MDEAIHRLQQAPAISHAQRQAMSRAVMVLARQAAIKEVKAAIQRQGRRKVCQIAHREIVAIAEEHLAANSAELIAKAKAIVECWHAEGVFGPRGGIRPPSATLSTSAQSAKA
jgi:glutamate racemase